MEETQIFSGHIINAMHGLGNEETIDIKTAQENDEAICKLKDYLEKEVRPSRTEISAESYFFKSLWNQWQRLDIQNGLLVRRWDVLGTDIVNWQVIVPLTQRRFVLRYSHDIPASGHLGVRKNVSKIRQKYYWPGLQSDVRMYIAGCEKCLKRKHPMKAKKAPMQVVRSGYPMERIAVDILGELPMTENGNKYILVVCDYFTKWTECFPMPNMEARTVANIMVTNVISRFGIPGNIHSDQGRQFVSKLFMEMCDLLQIEKTRTTPYHPQSDGKVERFNRTLCAFVNDNQRDWDEQLQYVMMAYRATDHETTGTSPNMMMLGRETTTPLDIAYEMPPGIRPIPENQYVWELRERLERVHSMVRQYTGQSIQRQKRYHDLKLSFDTFEAGDKVYVYFPVKKIGQTSKFTSFWRGPYTIVDKMSDVLYKVDCGRSSAIEVVHCDRLMRARSQTLFGEDASSFVEDVTPDIEPNYQPEPERHEEETIEVNEGRRTRKRPVWHDDYVLSTCRSAMPPKTKETPRKHVISPVCKEDVGHDVDFGEHVRQCSENRVKCSVCGFSFKKSIYLVKHMKSKHPEEATRDQSSSDGSSSSDDLSDVWDDQPDIVLDDNVILEKEKEKELVSGRVIRKPVEPRPVPAPRKRMHETPGPSKDVPRDGELKAKKKLKVDTGVQVQQTMTCQFCDITFTNQIMFTMHSGWHSYADPFTCNICGTSCDDRLTFYAHFSRAHQNQ